MDLEEYKTSQAQINALYARHAVFRAAVQTDAYAFVKRQKKRKATFAVDDERAIDLCSRYILEEVAVFSALALQGCTVELYPGPELEVLVDISRGMYPDVPDGLKQRINVEVRIGE
jgi:hypothetical protein